MRFRIIRLAATIAFVLAGCVPLRGPGTPSVVPVPSTAPSQPTVVATAPATPGGPITLTYWEEDTDEAGIVLDELVAQFMKANPQITVKRIHYSYDDLRSQFRETSRGTVDGEPPNLVRGPGEYAGPFSELGIVQPVDELFSAESLGLYLSGALDGATVRGRVWGLPDNFGNHLMLFYNRALVQTVAGDTNAWVTQLTGLTDTANGQYGLVFAANESFWLAPWLSGFGGWPLDAEDRPALDTAEMVEALWFIHDLKFADRVMPATTDYNEAFRIFGEGKAAYVIDGRWNLGRYQELGIDVGVASFPRVASTGMVPASMATGQYWYLAANIDPAKLDAAARLMEFMTSSSAQAQWFTKLVRLPSNRDTANSQLMLDDPNFAAMVAELRVSRGVPPALEMACAWRGIDSQLSAVTRGELSPDKAAPAMQEVAAACMAEIALDPTPTPPATPQ